MHITGKNSAKLFTTNGVLFPLLRYPFSSGRKYHVYMCTGQAAGRCFVVCAVQGSSQICIRGRRQK